MKKKDEDIINSIKELQLQLEKLEIEKKVIQAELNKNFNQLKDKDKNLEVGQYVLYCSYPGGKKMNKKGKIIRTTLKCVWIEDESGESTSSTKIRRSKSNVRMI
jgi:hypothetical protein